MFNIGYPAASRARIEDYVTCVRGLLAQGEATYQGRPQRVRWAPTAVRPRVPISICAEGPKMLHLGGRIGDGVIAGTGLLPEVIKDTIARVHAGAREAGRDPGRRRHLVHRALSLHEDRDTGDRERQGLGVVDPQPLHALRPRRQARARRSARARSRTTWTATSSTTTCCTPAAIPSAWTTLGLTDYAIDRLALAGAPRDWIARIEQLAERGAPKLWVGVNGADLDAQRHYLKLMGKEILPRFVG